MSSMAKTKRLYAEGINLRVSRNEKALIGRAAKLLGRSRSDLMLEAACREAVSVLLDRRYSLLHENCASRRCWTDRLESIRGWHVCFGPRPRGRSRNRSEIWAKDIRDSWRWWPEVPVDWDAR